jgi:hypothetical protein
VTVTDGATGATVKAIAFKLEPLEVAFSESAASPSTQSAAVAGRLSVNVGGRTIYLCAVARGESGAGVLREAGGDAALQPVELAFQEQYGEISRHVWVGKDLLLVGFQSGEQQPAPRNRTRWMASMG